MKCTNHPEREADGMCAYCGKPFCNDCLVEVKGRMYCKKDLGNVLDEAKQQASHAIPTINITNSNDSVNTNTNTNTNGFALPPRKSKMVALILCILGRSPQNVCRKSWKWRSSLLYIWNLSYWYYNRLDIHSFRWIQRQLWSTFGVNIKILPKEQKKPCIP